MAKLIIQEKLILANPKVKDSQADKFRAMALPGADEHYRSSVQYAYKNMDTRLYKSTKGGGFHDKVKASAKRHILDKFADHGITPNHAHIDRELDKAMAHWNKTQKGLKMKGVTESIDNHLSKMGFVRRGAGEWNHPTNGHKVIDHGLSGHTLTYHDAVGRKVTKSFTNTPDLISHIHSLKPSIVGPSGKRG